MYPQVQCHPKVWEKYERYIMFFTFLDFRDAPFAVAYIQELLTYCNQESKYYFILYLYYNNYTILHVSVKGFCQMDKMIIFKGCNCCPCGQMSFVILRVCICTLPGYMPNCGHLC